MMIELNYSDRIRNLTVSASGVVKSNKFFPVFDINGKEYIFKPLSKTKPLTTPMFACAEVFWSNYLSQFLKMPIYQHALCYGYDEEEPKYWNYGTLVENINNGHRMLNLYEYFEEHPDNTVNIHDYTNYCMMFYDYTKFFQTKFLIENKKAAEDMATQILMSILSVDENFHYENIQMYEMDDIVIAPMLDHEFSLPFLLSDHQQRCLVNFDDYANDMHNDNGITRNNIKCICELFPETAEKFLAFVKGHLPHATLNAQAFFPCNSEYYIVGHAKYKKHLHPTVIKFLETSTPLEDLDVQSCETFTNSLLEKAQKLFIDVLETELYK